MLFSGYLFHFSLHSLDDCIFRSYLPLPDTQTVSTVLPGPKYWEYWEILWEVLYNPFTWEPHLWSAHSGFLSAFCLPQCHINSVTFIPMSTPTLCKRLSPESKSKHTLSSYRSASHLFLDLASPLLFLQRWRLHIWWDQSREGSVLSPPPCTEAGWRLRQMPFSETARWEEQGWGSKAHSSSKLLGLFLVLSSSLVWG